MTKLAYVRNPVAWIAFLTVVACATTASARTNTLRIVTYNIEDDIGSFSGSNGVPRPGLIQPADGSGNYTGTVMDGGVVQGIGEEPLGVSNNFQALDIMVLQETTSNALTVAPIVSALNSYYSTPGMYAQSPVQGSQSGSVGFGNGPNAVVYNTQKVSLINSVGVGTAQGSSNGIYRQVMRYQFRPAGGTSADDFYIYVSHYKAGSTTSDQASRELEATAIRNNASTLPPTSRIIYAGDYNILTSSEDSYQTIVGSGPNQGIDPLNLTGATGVDWTTNSNNQQKTESATSLSARFDYMIMTSAMHPDPATFSPVTTGLQLIPSTYHTFGNNGTTARFGSTNSGGNTALNGVVQNGGTFITAAALKNDLTWSSDHLPVVADFSTGPGTSIWNGAGSASNWNTAQDWDSAPIDGDSLFFGGSTRTTNSNNSMTVVGAITFNSGAATFTLSGNAVTNLGGITNNSSNTQNVNLNQTLGAAQSFNAASGNISVGGTIATAGNLLTVTGGANTTLGGAVSGAGGLAKTGAGTLILSTTNSYTGGNTVGGGTVQLGATNALGSINNTLTVNSGTLDMHGFNISAGALNGSGGTIQSNVSGTVSLTVGNLVASGSYGGQIQNGSGVVGVVKASSGTQILSGNNNYTGGTQISAGTLQLGHTNALGNASGGLSVTGTLDLHGFSPTVGSLNGAGTIQTNVAGAATLTVGSGNGGGTFSGQVLNNSGTVGVAKTGSGIQILSGSNNYSGGTTVGGGTLQLGSVNALGSTSGAVTVNSGTLDLHGFGPTIGGLNGTGGAVQSNVAGAVSLTLGNGGAGGSYAGQIANGSGTVSVFKTGAGVQTLSGSNSYSGGTTVSGGTLNVGNANALGTAGLTINSAASTVLTYSGTQAVAVPNLSIDGGSATPTSTLDISNKKLVVNNANLGAAIATHATITNQVENAYDGFTWDGAGITSSVVQNDVNNSGSLTAVGIMLNDDGAGGNFYQELNGSATFGGKTTDSNSVLVRYTYLGDLDLDGVITTQDYTLFTSGYLGGAPVVDWAWGDMDYDGAITSQDYSNFTAGYLANLGQPAITGGSVEPVPEPATLLLGSIGFGFIALVRYRRRRHAGTMTSCE